MISEDVLTHLAPADIFPLAEPEIGELPEDISESALLLTAWSERLQMDLIQSYSDTAERADLDIRDRFHKDIHKSMLVGIGLQEWFDAPEDDCPFPAINGLRLGFGLFQSEACFEEETSRNYLVRLGEHQYPVVRYGANFMAEFAPKKSSAALLVDLPGTGQGILTAAHCVSTQKIGNSVSLECRSCGTRVRGILAAHGGPYLDAAIVTPETSFPCCCIPRPALTFTRRATTGLAIRNHFRGNPVDATVLQGIDTPATILSAATPQNILTTKLGRDGDSGSLVTNRGGDIAVAMHLGRTSLKLPRQSAFVLRSFALQVSQPLAIFGAQPLEGFIA